MRSLLLVFFFSILGLHVSAEPLECYKNQSEYEAIKTKLPKILQSVPLFLAVEKAKVLWKVVSAVGSMQFVDGNMRFYFNVSTGLAEPFQPPVSVCANSEEIKITFPNKKVESFKVLSDSELAAKFDVKMTKVSKETFNRVSSSLAVTDSTTSKDESKSSGGQVQ